MKPPVIAITGGIGSGKSVVSKILRVRGFRVVDTDSHARSIMDGSAEIKRRLMAEIHPEAVDSAGIINRKLVGQIVFADAAKLALLNSIVHGSVRDSILEMVRGSREPLFIETAILFQSGLNRLVDAEWRVESPLELRLERTMRRSGLTREQVQARIQAQEYEPAPGEPLPPVTYLYNDSRPLLPQIDSAIEGVRKIRKP